MKKLVLITALFLSVVITFGQSFRQAAQVRKDSLKADLNRAQLLTRQGNAGEASKIYTRIMETVPDNKDAVHGWLIANMKRSPTGEEEAINQLEQLQKSYPENIGILFYKAFLEAKHGRNEDALKNIDKLTNLQPDTAVNWIMKGQLLYDLKRYEEAFNAFERATSLDPKRADVWGMKAGALTATGKFDEALTATNKGLELSPNNPISLYNRACIYCRKGDKGNALEDLKKAVSMNPSFKEYARKDEDFKSLYDDEDFKKITGK